MYEILENTPNRLAIRLGARGLHSTTTVLDKTTGRARFERKQFFWGRKPIDVPIADIAGLDMLSLRRGDASILLRLRDGSRRYLSGDNPATTEEAARQMRGFLGLPETGPDAAMKALPPVYRFGMRAAWVGLVIAALLAVTTQVSEYFFLPGCDSKRARDTLQSIIRKAANMEMTGLKDVVTLTDARGEKTCQGQAEFAAETVKIAYRIYWEGWSAIVQFTGTVSRGPDVPGETAGRAFARN